MIDYIEDVENKFIEVHVKGKISVQDIEESWQKIDARLEQWDKIKVLKRIDSLPSIEIPALWQGLLQGGKHMGRVGSTAIVTDKQWLNKISQFLGLLAGMNIKCFSLEQLEEARVWLAEQSDS